MIDLSEGQFYIFPVSDLHYGSSWFSKPVFDKWVEAFENTWDNKCIYLLGDLLEFSTTRVDAYSSNKTTEDSINEVIELFEPYKEYIRFVAAGNHELRGKKEFNLDVTKIIAKELDAIYTRNDFFDKINLNGNEFVVYGKHGTNVSKYSDLAMKNYKLEMGNIDADLYLHGHNHLLEFSQKIQRCFDGYYTKHYAFTGHYLTYKNSYTHNKGMIPTPPGFLRIGVDSKLNVSCKKYRGGCGL